jgi:hypothetical protein
MYLNHSSFRQYHYTESGIGAYSGHGRPPFRLMPDQDSG